ncbi:MAG: hypothetical protein ACLQLH_02905 [Terracidiphilus sp.]
MNDPVHNPIAQGEAEETLRLIAHLPVPQGLEDRVRAALHSRPRQGRILSWPSVPRLESNWMRSAAAAAIVFVVAGGGWGIYSHVQPPQAKVIVMPMHVAPQGGFSSAGAMRTPNTLNGPVLVQPVQAPSKLARPVVKFPKPATLKPNRSVPPSAPGNAAAQAAK